MKSYGDKQATAISQTERVAKVEGQHPKSWDRYIAKRQKQVKEQRGGKNA